MKFTLTITLGNAAMTIGLDVAALVQKVAGAMAAHGDTDLTEDEDFEGDGGSIMDLNGNKVGSWEVG